MMSLISTLGYLNLALMVCLLSPFLLRRLNRHVFHSKNQLLGKAASSFAKAHPYLGPILLLSAMFHGYLALGVIMLHTGTVLGSAIILQNILGLSFKLFGKPVLLKVHRPLGLLSVIFLLAHLL
jgi:hypothetical protein